MASVTVRKSRASESYMNGTPANDVNPTKYLAQWEVIRDGEVVAYIKHRELIDAATGKRIRVPGGMQYGKAISPHRTNDVKYYAKKLYEEV